MHEEYTQDNRYSTKRTMQCGSFWRDVMKNAVLEEKLTGIIKKNLPVNKQENNKVFRVDKNIITKGG